MHISVQLPVVVNDIIAFTLRRLRERNQNGTLYAHCDLDFSEFILCNTAQYLNSPSTHQITMHFGASGLRTFHTNFVHRPLNGECVTYYFTRTASPLQTTRLTMLEKESFFVENHTQYTNTSTFCGQNAEHMMLQQAEHRYL